jgi:putative hydrolase of the HAD superfamily
VTLPAPNAVLFDFGNTLLREGPLDLAAGARRILEIAGDANGCTPERLAAELTDLFADLDARRRASLLEPPPETVRRLVYDPLGLRFELPPDEVEWEFWRASIPWTAEPGIADLAETLVRRRLSTGVLSNAMFRGCTMERQLAVAGLSRAFPWVMTSADWGLRKPHRRVFALAARRIGVEPGRIWFVGDSYEHDVGGAAAAGMVPIWYRPAGGAEAPRAPAAAVVSAWIEFRDLLEDTLGRSV